MSMTPLHYDSTDGYICQVAGYKRVYLFAPDDSLYLSPKTPFTGGQFNLSEITHIHNISLDNHPYFLRATCHSIILKPGDTLYIPQGWWHNVFNLTKSTAINFFFTDKMKGDTPKQEILIYQASKNSKTMKINEVINRGQYEYCFEIALDLIELNCLDYAAYYALTYFEEYLKASFMKYVFLEIKNNSYDNEKKNQVIEELHSLAIHLFNSRQSGSEVAYYNLEKANEYLLSHQYRGHLPHPLVQEWISLARTLLKGGQQGIKAEDLKLIIEEIRAACRPELINQ